jgi:hypothetical protein
MKTISTAHHDSHEALIALALRSREVHIGLLVDAKMALEERKVEIICRKMADPWYMKLLFERTTQHEEWIVRQNEQCLAFLDKVLERAKFEVTIELDNAESDILFRKS